MKKLLSIAALAAMVTTLVAGEVIVKGSDTMLNLTQRLAEAFSAASPDITVSVAGGGSGVGINAVVNNEVEIGNSMASAGAPKKPPIAPLIPVPMVCLRLDAGPLPAGLSVLSETASSFSSTDRTVASIRSDAPDGSTAMTCSMGVPTRSLILAMKPG